MNSKTSIITFFVAAAAISVMANAQAPMGAPALSPAAAPGPAVDCTTALLGMADCLTFVQVGSNETKPDSACCPELSGLLKTQPICLCQLLGNTSASFGVQIDLAKALKLPSACRLSTPPLSLCSGAGAPSPTESPASSPGGLSPEGAAASPGSPNAKSGATSIAASGVVTFLISLAIAFSNTLF